ncbi:MerR family transcriptional regulator [Paenibacillus sinopodophylli]|uniref:MerR family transcriptional regulator n=1 Tax=Paenibacillus sinopodophylli TaxID=1837342 RepID=UPI00110CEC89|nr:MerR family transcriptional regulator [Paenibacillus sinopodophylli]
MATIGMTIKETSEQAGLSEDTIRYYERIGLLPRAERKENRHRVYRAEDVETMKLITCLKKTGMSLEEMKPYLDLSMQNDLSASPELIDMILSHKRKIEQQMVALQQIVDLIDTRLVRGHFAPESCTLPSEGKRMPVAPASKQRH